MGKKSKGKLKRSKSIVVDKGKHMRRTKSAVREYSLVPPYPVS